MLPMFRRFASSPIGLAIFALIIIAFIVTLYEGRAGTSVFSGPSIATVGDASIGEAELVRQVQNRLDQVRQREPGTDMAAFVAKGGVDQTIDLAIDGRALDIFASRQGMVVSRKLVDGEIASIPAFNGPTGSFDRATFLNLLAQRKMSEAQLREDLRRDALSKALLIPISAASKVSIGFAEPYAGLLLESRSGEIAELPSAKFAAAAAPSDAEVTQFYQRNIARYTLPQRRVIRYAVFNRSQVASKAVVTDAEIEAFYKANGDRYAAREKRGFTQLILPDEAQAKDLLGRINDGMSLDAAARSVKRDPLKVDPLDKAGFEKMTSAAVASAAFATEKGKVAAIARSGLGYHVVRVDTIDRIAATPLSAVRVQIATDLATAKADSALSDLVAKIEDSASNNATFDEIVKANGLTAVDTPALIASGAAPDEPGYRAPPELAPVLTEVFQAEPDDDPAVNASTDRKTFVLWKLDRIVPPAPRPLAPMRDQVIADFRLDAGSKAAKTAADAIVAAVNGGTPLGQAIAKAGVPLPAPQPIKATRMQLAQARENVPPPLAMMFAMAEKRARVLQMPGRQGWYIVYLGSIQRGDPRSQPGLIQAAQRDIAGIVSDEYVQQFARSIHAQLGATKNADGIARLKRSLATGGATP